MSKAILVTGATGKTGSEVVKGLLARGKSVQVGAHTPAKAAAMFGAHAGVTVVPLDFGRRCRGPRPRPRRRVSAPKPATSARWG